ncbi:carboxy terminal-processing peptidase [Runella slithyformis]|uniref:Carboxyl-terminal protease n=1 Tax=Runella slithyformis (strain ATCC 29530 / DSM 19594 / LMG 11500 / NCIMB 11436 / LSU 4) TaxID=761193 RepID=A0A7U3ZLD4_RUNSL|nr:carboxy terminal-processing peptidase [Runella slithyformis]AEI49336.1 carboxyl-terminal protease [Runella slithyformis DSM 19594]
MKSFLIALAPVLLLSLQPDDSRSRVVPSRPFAVSDDDLKPTLTQEKVEAYVTKIFSGYHYRKFNVNDSLSSKMYDNYLSDIDRGKLYFLASDAQYFEKYRTQLDEALNNGDLTAAYDIYNTFRKRYRERSNYITKLLANPKFDFTVDESFNTDREKATWAKNTEELDEIWRKLLKNEALELKLSGKADSSVVTLLRDRYKNRERNLGRFRSEQVFQMYMNAFCEVLDPHTRYFSPTDSDRFKQDMYQALEGIGAVLREDGNYIKVVEVVPGGPAFKDKRLKKDDRIIGVAQGDEGKFEDIVGWYVDDAVKKIKGAKGTTVRLQVLAGDALANDPPKEIRLVREKVNLQTSRARKEIVTLNQNKHDYKIGIINIPSFYRDFEGAGKRDKDFASTTRDVQKIIDSLKAENVEGIVIDLRNNGGGSLTEAISLTGLFIPKGPVVQVRESSGDTEVQTDPDPSVTYDGPIAVLINRFSASASEIFAAAIQDYKRGIILGEQTYGKGTVQTMVDLNQWIKDTDKLGQINITVAKFYRINGSSTQRKGVSPDIEFPSAFSAEEYGESSQPTALPWDQIATARFDLSKALNEKQVAKLKEKYQQRLKSETEMKTFVDELELFRKARENTVVSLQETKRKKEREEAEKKRAALKKLETEEEVDDDESTTPAKAADKKKKDIYMNETNRILADYIALSKSPSVAKR